jgi:hypothetical protein
VFPVISVFPVVKSWKVRLSQRSQVAVLSDLCGKSFAFLDCTTPAGVFKKPLTAEIAEEPEIAENAKFSVRLPGDPYVSCA